MTGGAELAAGYSRGVVEPLIVGRLPGLPFSTARLGSGSDVLGFDDAMSQDHDWGLRLTVVVPDGAVDAVERLLEDGLPESFRSLPVRFATTWDPRVHQRVEVATAAMLALSRTGVDTTRPLRLLDHLCLTDQAVLEVTAGPVIRDDDGVLTGLRAAFEQPEDVRLWRMAAAWQRVAEELPFVGRTAERGDHLGSGIVVARLAQSLMRIGFLLGRRRAPYSKWLGTAFRLLPVADELGPHLDAAVAARDWQHAERALADGSEVLAVEQSRQGLPTPDSIADPFWSRPYRGLRPVADGLRGAIGDPVLRALPLLGTPEQWSDDVRLLVDHGMRRRATAALLGL